jgi:bacillithiol biosynthesis cysteine-adding enzyme BshC
VVIPHTSRLFQDYLHDYSRVSEFYSAAPFATESFQEIARSLQYSAELRSAVAQVLGEHAERFRSGPEAFRSLEQFAKPGCCAVVTGQQVGLFTGPTFAIYKALTAIKLARSLSRDGIEAVPVFWLATEDHDFEEVNHCFAQDRAGAPRRLEYPAMLPAPNVPAGAVRLSEEIVPVIAVLRETLSDLPAAEEIGVLVEETYRPGASFGEAFGALMARLFQRYGVLLIDSLDVRLHRLSRSVFQVAVEEASEIHQELIERNRRLAEAGYHAQVHVAENQTTLFLYEGGQRTALRMEDGKFVSSLGCKYRAKDLQAMLEAQPELFSPNVLLRPVMQDALLPTVAYVGGPSEVAYLAQAAPLYRHVFKERGRRMPVVFPRANFTVLEAASSRLLGKYDLTLTDVFAGQQALREKMAARTLPESIAGLFEKASANLEESFNAIKEGLERVDSTLVDAALNSEQKMQYQLSNLERKAAAAAQRRSDQVEKDALRLENNLFPQKTLQERFYSGVSLLARFGIPLLDNLYRCISLDSGDHQIITP